MRRGFKPCQVRRIPMASGVGMGAKEMADREFDADEHISKMFEFYSKETLCKKDI